ncbi:ribonuclease III [Litorivita pollutaquae]|uniref:Ribonuclease III n=1 Tax=Litorivita pollutaquae TaxID=2200892 RepID=A0A2V4NRM1_9RHOB|nr:DUF2793 domain-containing protein [Litorivita pollutaquae]PYC47366.1 ribonuclease III [Litorivita pollutaquae]
MPDQSPILSLPYIAPSQAQKHVTHNEALRKLDAIVQLVALDNALTAPPAVPNEGDCYIVAPGAGGLWATYDHTIAVYDSDLWMFYAPKEGWRAEVLSSGMTLRFDGTLWQDAGTQLQNLPEVGINTSADSSNRLAVSAEASLFTHEGAGHQMKMNKNASGDTGSLLFQTNWSGRAEIGLMGDDDLAFKVSSDGTSWTDVLRFDGTVGSATFGVDVFAESINATSRFNLPIYTMATLPSATTQGQGAVIFVTDAPEGAEPYYSRGSTWRRMRNGTVLS